MRTSDVTGLVVPNVKRRVARQLRDNLVGLNETLQRVVIVP